MGSIWVVSRCKKLDFSLKMLYADLENCASCVGGEHILIKKGGNDRRKMKSESEKRSMASLMPI